MKKILLTALSVVLCISVSAQTKNLSAQRIGKLHQRTEIKTKSMQRQTTKKDYRQLNLQAYNQSATATPSTKAKAATLWSSELPEQRWFPGEWEEVQAIVVTFPYNVYPADHIGDEDYTAETGVPGMGILYKWNNITNNWTYYNGGWGAIAGVPDTANYDREIAYYQQFIGTQYSQMAQEYIEYFETQKSFRSVFTNLIDAIQHGSQVWIAVWSLNDSTLIKNLMAEEGKPLTNYRFIECYTDAFWYRDCGPICFYYGDNDDIAMLNFEYIGRACDDLLPDSIASQIGLPNYITTLEWEGGNCLVDGAGKLVTSDAIYAENADREGQLYATGNASNPIDYRTKTPLTSQAVLDSMQRMFGTTYILPRLRYDGGTGHVDLYTDMWDENEFIFSQYPTQYSQWVDYTTVTNNINTLIGYQSLFGFNYKKSYIPFPLKDNGSFFSSQTDYNNNYTRSYSNHTFVNNIIIQPCFSPVENGEPTADWDRANLDSLCKAYPGYTLYPIDIRSFDGLGGAIHCITKQIPADNPIRILHASTTQHDGTQRIANKTMEAIITNRSGIAGASLYWRVDEGEWHNQTLSEGDNNQFSCVMQFDEASINDGSVHTVEYYISATSNNGKTITKPMTASQGGYYTFDVIYDTEAGINTIEEQNIGQFYPNPTNGHTTIDLDADVHYQISIIDVLGHVVRNETLDKGVSNGHYRLDTQTLPNGLYSVRFTTKDGNSVVRRLLVQNKL